MEFKVYRLNFCKRFTAMLLTLLFVSLFAVTEASGAATKVSGVVKDATGAALIGATVIEKGTTANGVVTGLKGEFTISVNPGATLIVQHLGHTTIEVPVGSRSAVNVVMQNDTETIEDVVVVGYGVQKKATLTGAVSSIKNDEIVSTKNENVMNMLTGKVAGLRVVQNSSEPGQFNNSLDIRGFGAPLIVIDGIPRGNMARLDAEDIESISVLKDGSAAVYGVRAANGVVVITTKKGTQGRATISYSGNMTWQRPSNFPELVGGADWMTLYNERLVHDVNNSARPHTYSDAEIEEYRNGTKKSTNWREEVMRKSAPQTQHTLSASGGTDALSYYASMGYQSQGSFFTENPINYDKYTLRANIAAKVSKNIKFDLNVAGMMDKRESSVYGSQDIIRSMWLLRPMDPVYHNQEEGQYYRETWNKGILNPVAMQNKDMVGENSYKSKWFQSSAAITYNFPHLKGLSLKGLYSYDFTLNENNEYAKTYMLYNSNYPDGTISNSKMDAGKYKSSRYYYGKNASLWQAQIAYANTFGRHSVSALALFENAHSDGDNFYGTRFSDMPLNQIFTGMEDMQEFKQSSDAGALYDNANQALVARVNYDFGGKYLAEVAFRYEGSNKFPEETRWGFFPTASVGWRISEEKFWQNSPLNFVTNMKLRASYGETGDDSASTFQFLNGYNYPSSKNPRTYPGGYIFGDTFINSSSDKGIANKEITWYVAKTFNVGVDAEAWNGLIGFTGDYFRRNRSGLLARRSGSLPGIVGAGLPQENLNGDLTQGFEIELSHRNRIGEVSYQVKGNIAYTRVKTLHSERAREGNSFSNWRNNTNDRYNNIWWGYAGNGRITSWDEIYYNPVYIGRGTILGDYEYVDWNNDGMISDLDVHPLATNGKVPLLNYGLSLSVQWKGLDMSMLWQGAGRKYVIPREFMYQPLWADTNATTDFLDRWRPADSHADPYNPATDWISGKYGYTGSLPNASSDFNIQNAAYLRLKNIEIGYSLPKKWLSTVNLQSVRIYFSAYNVLTFTKLKYMDPEFFNNASGSSLGDLGYNYPINKTFTLGVNVKF